MAELTPDERRWIASLHRLAKKRPQTLGLWGGWGNLTVVALSEDGHLQHDGVAQGGEGIVTVEDIDIPTGGGDPYNVTLDEIERPWVDRASPSTSEEKSMTIYCTKCDGNAEIEYPVHRHLHPADPAQDIKSIKCDRCDGTGIEPADADEEESS